MVNAVVRVGAVRVDDFAEETGANHVEDGEVVAPETPIFEHHARDADALGGLDELPALRDRQRDGHLDRRCRAVL